MLNKERRKYFEKKMDESDEIHNLLNKSKLFKYLSEDDKKKLVVELLKEEQYHRIYEALISLGSAIKNR